MKEMRELVKTCVLLWEKIEARDKAASMEAATVLLLQFMDIFGHDMNFVEKFFPHLERMKHLIQSEQYEEASALVLAFQVKFGRVAERLEEKR